MTIAGLIYLHDISQLRLSATVHKNLDLFRVLCGEDAITRVVLATTKWNRVDPAVGEQRELELKKELWGNMMTAGAQSVRFEGTHESACTIIRTIPRKYMDNWHPINDNHILML